MEYRGFKQKVGRSLNASRIRENANRILLTLNDSLSDNVTYELEPLLPFFYKCPRYRVCRCFNTRRTKYITSKTSAVKETFQKDTFVVMEESDCFISFFWLSDDGKIKNYNRYDYDIRDGRKCSFSDGVYCSDNNRVTQMKYLQKSDNGLSVMAKL